MKTAFVFSGQGAQYNGMGAELYQNFSSARTIFNQSSEAVGYDMADLCFSNHQKLHQTSYTQPAILTVSLAILNVLEKEFQFTPQMVAGLSLGEYSALVASGCLSLAETVPLLQKRGKYMSEAVPAGVGAMSAVFGLERAIVQAVCQQASSIGVVCPANYNMPGQIVIAGEVKALEHAESLLQTAGAKRVIRLNVSGPFHTPFMQVAANKLALDLAEVTVKPMAVPVVTNVTGQIIEDETKVKPLLIKQVQSPVYWEESVQTMIDNGVDTFVELGPGKALSGFIRKINRAVTVLHVEDQKSLTKTVNILKKKRGEESC